MFTRSRRLAAIAIVLVVGCGGGSECKVETVQYTKSLNAVGNTGASQGVPLARFDLTQDFVTHTPYEACAQGPLEDAGNVSLSITSLATAPVFIIYDVQGLNAGGNLVWFYPDTMGVTLAPQQTVNVGQIMLSTTKLGDGGARLVIRTAMYVP